MGLIEKYEVCAKECAEAEKPFCAFLPRAPLAERQCYWHNNGVFAVNTSVQKVSQ